MYVCFAASKVKCAAMKFSRMVEQIQTMLKRLICISLLLLLHKALLSQCNVGYTQAQLNWDYLNYWYNSGGSSPYGSYINDTREQSQRYAIGSNWLTIATSSNALVTTTENTSHAGDVAAMYAGADVQYNPSAGGQTITITFNDEAMNVQFSLYDVDRSQQINFSASNAASVAQTINVVTYASSILTINNNNTTTANIVANTTSLSSPSNQGTATITVAGPVKTITLTIQTVGSDAVFWLSDINACITGSFPSNWHQGWNNQPFSGFTQNQPDYFLVTPDNNSCYMMDPTTGRCWWLFTDTNKTYMNSYAYDPQNKYLYYISENASLNSNNRELRRYDFNSETISIVVADISTTLNIPTFNSGIETAGSFYYNNKLYLGIEGGQSTSTIRESIIWCIDLSTNISYQIFGTPSYNGSGLIQDWADFIVKDGMLYNFNSARNGTSYANSSYTHLNLMTGAATVYTNPVATNKYAGQAGMSWNANKYMIYDSVWLYDAGVISSRQPISVITVPGEPAPPAWTGNAGDASDPFRPKCDFGDAPATYDPNAQMPAVHERAEAIYLGTAWDKEWLKRGTSGTDDVDEGLTTVPSLVIGPSSTYAAQVTVYNNNGADATMIGWLDYNGNGVFDSGEASTPVTVASTGSQTLWLSWPSTPNTFTDGQTTYLRIRITSASAGMTSSHATGYFTNGEVEDYLVYAYTSPLTVNNLDFEAALVNNDIAKLNWSGNEPENFIGYEVQKSAEGTTWNVLGIVAKNQQPGTRFYEFRDNKPFETTSYYRLRLLGVGGPTKFSDIRMIKRLLLSDAVLIRPNPVKNMALISIESAMNCMGDLTLINGEGKILLTRSFPLERGRNEIQLPVAPEWPSGNYFLRVLVNREIIRKKLMIQK